MLSVPCTFQYYNRSERGGEVWRCDEREFSMPLYISVLQRGGEVWRCDVWELSVPCIFQCYNVVERYEDVMKESWVCPVYFSVTTWWRGMKMWCMRVECALYISVLQCGGEVRRCDVRELSMPCIFQCYNVVEHYEEVIEDWYYNYQHRDIMDYLCRDHVLAPDDQSM